MKKKSIILLCTAMLMLGVSGCQSDADNKDDSNYAMEEFAGNKYRNSDESVIYFNEDASFIWFQSDDCRDDNYYSGTYEVYLAQDAVDYIVNELTEFGVTQEELDEYFERTAGDDFYQLSNYCCMVLHNEEVKIGGEFKKESSSDKYYMGFYDDGYFDAANMKTGNYSSFTLVEGE